MRGSLVLTAALCMAITSPAHADGERRRGRAEVAPTPIETLANANNTARQRPDSGSFQEARHIYTYEPGALYELYTNPNYVSTILLEPGEILNNIAAGDTSRWMVSQAEGETDSEGRTIVLVKPQAANLRTNIVLITDRRTYLVEAVSRGDSVYSAQVAWTYPQSTEQGHTPGIENLNFNYRIRATRGQRPEWLPTRAFDDGRRTYVEFPNAVASSDMPPLFVITADGAELVNYRVQGQRYVVDRIFETAELRLGTNAQTIVRIERNPTDRTRQTPRRRPHP